MVDGHKNQVSDNMGDTSNRTVEQSGSEARMLCHPQQRTERRSETGDKVEELVRVGDDRSKSG